MGSRLDTFGLGRGWHIKSHGGSLVWKNACLILF